MTTLSVLVFVAIGLNDIFHITGLVNSYLLTPIGSFFGVFFLAGAVNKDIEQTYKERDNLVKSLKNSLKLTQLAKDNEEKFRQELECWAPPFILNLADEKSITFPHIKSLAVITYDIVRSSELHDKFHNNVSIRSLVLRGFTEILLKNGAWRESHSGDSAFGHIGLFKQVYDSCDNLLKVAVEFKQFIEQLKKDSNINFECGIGLHYANNCLVDIHKVEVNSPELKFTQKSFDATSSGIDLVHRVEKLAHDLPGTNILMTHEFYTLLKTQNLEINSFGSFNFKGQPKRVDVYLYKKSILNQNDDVSNSELDMNS